MAEPAAPLGRPSLKIAPPAPRTAYHVDHGAFDFPYPIDARMAVANHPNEWSWDAWTPERIEQARARLAAHHSNMKEAARNLGLPEPEAPKSPPLVALTPEEQEALDEFRKRQAEAKERIRLRQEAEAKQREADAQADADEEIVRQPPPLPDLKDPKRLHGAAKANAEAKAKREADAKAAADKAASDRARGA